MTNKIKRISQDRPVLDSQIDFSDLEQSGQDQPAVLEQLLPDKGPIIYQKVPVWKDGQKTIAYRLQVNPNVSMSAAMNFGGSFAIGFWLVTVLISPALLCVGAIIWSILSAMGLALF